MTTIVYQKDSDTFHIVNEGRSAYVSSNTLYSRIIVLDLVLAARLAVENAPDVVTVSRVTTAKGLRPKDAQVYGLQQ